MQTPSDDHQDTQPRRVPLTPDTLLDIIQDAVIRTDPDFRITGWNRAAEALYGWSATEAIGHLAQQLLQTDFLGAEQSQLIAQLQEQGVWRGELRHYHRDGRAITILATVTWMCAPDGQPIGAFSLNQDISEHTRIKAALLAREQQLTSILESVDGRLWSVDRELCLLVGNARFQRDARAITGRELRPGESVLALPMPEEWRARWRAWYERALAGEAFSIEQQLAEITATYRFLPIRTAEGLVSGVTVVGVDITSHVRAETARQETERRLGALFELLPVGVSILNPERRVVYTNPALDQILQLDRAAMAQQVYTQRQYLRSDGTPMPPEEFASVRAAREHQAVTNVETGIVTESGETIWTSVSAAPVDFPDWHMVVVTTDITARKRAEQTLQRSAERLHILAEASRVFAEAGVDYTTVQDQIARAIVTILGEGCIIALISDDGAWIQAHHVYDVDADIRELTRSLISSRQLIDESSTNARVFRTGQPLFIPVVDLSQILAAAKPEYAAMIRRQNFHSLMVVPMRALGRVIGVLTLYRRHRERPAFDTEDLSLVQDLADRAALTIANARLLQQVQVELAERQQAQKVTELLYVAGQLLARPLGRDEVLNTLLDVLQQLIPYDSANIMLPDGPMTFRVRYLRGYETWTDPEAVKALVFDVTQQAPLSHIIATQRSLLIADTHQESTWESMLGMRAIRCWLGVPLIANNTLVGIFSIDRYQPNSLTTNDVRLAETLAVSAATAIERVQLLTQLRDEREQLARRVAERTADLSLANAELTRATRLKDEFLASMSHELRTPLNSILGRSEALQEAIYGPVTPEQTASLREIEESGRHLLVLINDILDLSKIEAGRLDLDAQPVQIDLLCPLCLRMVAQTALMKRISLSSTYDSQVQTLVGDERRLKQILVNLLSNAVKFTPEGGKVGLEVSGDPVEQTVTFTVWDTGIGISADDLPKLFQPFVQLDSSLSRQYTGTGLGLSLVSRLAKAHGGGVRVESTPGVGSRFHVTLPWDSAAPRDRTTPETTVLPTRLPVIGQAMVIEDSPTAAEQLARYLHELGAQVEVLPHGTGVIERAIVLQPDVILLDILLPDDDGWQVLRQLKAEPRSQAIPIIIVSVVDLPERARTLGAAASLLKPIDRVMLEHTLRRVLSRQEDTFIHLALVATPTTRPPKLLLAEDSETNIATISDYLRAKGYDVVIARNGAEAVVRSQEERPDVILMDIQMPGMDGFETIRRIRAESELAKIPIIAVTALAMPGDRERCLEAGADDYLTKPVQLRKLTATIEALRGKHG